jgi:hypothetical protein
VRARNGRRLQRSRRRFLVRVVERNTQLTETVKALTERVEMLTREVHAMLSIHYHPHGDELLSAFISAGFQPEPFPSPSLISVPGPAAECSG